jgi:hypothetical protein
MMVIMMKMMRMTLPLLRLKRTVVVVVVIVVIAIQDRKSMLDYLVRANLLEESPLCMIFQVPNLPEVFSFLRP